VAGHAASADWAAATVFARRRDSSSGLACVGDDADDLADVDLAQGTAECRRILREHGDLPAVDPPDPGDDPRAACAACRMRACGGVPGCRIQ
jgi:hypothetical protein